MRSLFLASFALMACVASVVLACVGHVAVAGGTAGVGTESLRGSAIQETEFAGRMLFELNRLRENPASFLPDLEQRLARFEGNRLRLDPHTVLVTQEGPAAVKEAMAFLRRAEKLRPLKASTALDRAAAQHVADLGPRGNTGHMGSDGSSPNDRMRRFAKLEIASAENLAFGENDPRGVVLQLLIDDGVANRGHRRNMFSPKFSVVGVACGPHKVYGRVCVMDFAGGVVPHRGTE